MSPITVEAIEEGVLVRVSETADPTNFRELSTTDALAWLVDLTSLVLCRAHIIKPENQLEVKVLGREMRHITDAMNAALGFPKFEAVPDAPVYDPEVIAKGIAKQRAALARE